MKKKIILALVITLLTTSFMGCNKEEVKNENTPAKMSLEEENNVGKWNFEYTKEELEEINKEIMSRVEEQTETFGLEYEIVEEVTTEKERPVKLTYIHTNNLNPEPNRLESMYYAYKLYEENLSLGKLVMKLSFNLDTDKIKEEGEFNFEDTSLAKYSQAFLNDDARDYSELNNQIYSMVTGQSDKNIVENNIEGLKETVMVQDKCLIYILETKEYNFKQ